MAATHVALVDRLEPSPAETRPAQPGLRQRAALRRHHETLRSPAART